MKQVGRNIYYEKSVKTYADLSLFRRLIKRYFEFRIKLIDKRIYKYGSYANGYEKELFNAAVYTKQSYLHKIEALYLKQELRDYERRIKRGKKDIMF